MYSSPTLYLLLLFPDTEVLMHFFVIIEHWIMTFCRFWFYYMLLYSVLSAFIFIGYKLLLVDVALLISCASQVCIIS
jgi:hypothetical protein